MSRKKTGNEGTKPALITTVKIDPDLVDMARMVAIRSKKSLQDYIDEVLRPAVERDYQAMIRDEAGKMKK